MEYTTEQYIEAAKRRMNYSISDTGCWIWQGSTDKDGYGYFSIMVPAKERRSHRSTWVLFNGPIPEGMCVCHSCDEPACVNPEHLWIGTQQDNTADRTRKGRTKGRSGSLSEFCKRGHEFTEENTRRAFRNDGYGEYRKCRECDNMRARNAWERRKR